MQWIVILDKNVTLDRWPTESFRIDIYMIVYYIIGGVILVVQLVVLLEAYRNLIFTVRKYRPKSSPYRPRVALISPCKGLDTTFDRNIDALFDQDYPDYELFFVVESRDDPAHGQLEQIIDRRHSEGCAVKAHLVVAGLAERCAQKIHNLLAAIDTLSADIKVMAFIDSDACPKAHFLSSLVHPLRCTTVGASTGHRWFVPTDSRLSSRVLSAMNAFFASTLGPHEWNAAWGGAMAIRRDIWDQTGVLNRWENAVSDDYTLTRAVREANLIIAFVPACFVASYESTTWGDMFSFARRQFIITRVCAPGYWYLAILGIGHVLAGFWGGLAVTVVLLAKGSPGAAWAAILPATLMLLSGVKALLRQVMIRRILPEDRKALFAPGAIDVFLGPLLHLFTFGCLLSSGLARTIIWRGIRYTLHGPQQTTIHRLSGESL